MRNRLIEFLNKQKIFVTVNFKSITKLSYYKKKYKNKKCLNSDIWGEQCLSLPFHAKMKKSEIEQIHKQLKIFFNNN